MKSLSHIATRFIGVPLMMDPLKYEVIFNALSPRLGMPVSLTPIDISGDPAAQRLMAHYQDSAAQERPYSIFGGVAVISVQGTLIRRGSWMDAYSGCCSYEDIEGQLTQAMDDAAVNSVLFDIDSPGGEVSGCFELADFIHSMRGKKPMYAVSNDCAASAAYAIASAADKIFVGRTGAVGSIGVFALHAEQAELDKKIGVAYSYIFAGKTKVDGNPHEPLSDRARAEIQKEVTREYGIFTETVSRNRGADVKDIVGTDARMLWADAAVPLLADEIGTFDDAMNALVALGSKTPGTKRSTRAASAVGEIDNMAETLIAATAPCDEAEDEMKTKGKAAPDPDEKKDKTDPDEKKDKTDPDNDGDTDAKKKAAAALAAAPAVGASVYQASRTEEDIVSIGNLCKMAGADFSTYITKRVTSGRYMTVAEVSNELTENRSNEAGKTALMNNVDVANNAGTKVTVGRLQTEATAFARANSRTEANNLFFPGKRKGTTPEQAFAASLEANPEVYEQFREKHNAQALVQQLTKAGYKLQAA